MHTVHAFYYSEWDIANCFVDYILRPTFYLMPWRRSAGGGGGELTGCLTLPPGRPTNAQQVYDEGCVTWRSQRFFKNKPKRPLISRTYYELTESNINNKSKVSINRFKTKIDN